MEQTKLPLWRFVVVMYMQYIHNKSEFYRTWSYCFWQRWSPRGHPWPWGQILKSLALASKVKSLALKPQVLENCPVLGLRTALFFEQLKFRWKTPETLQKICEHLFCFPHLEHRRSQREGTGGPPPPYYPKKMGSFCPKICHLRPTCSLFVNVSINQGRIYHNMTEYQQ